MRKFKHPAALLTAFLVVLSPTDSFAQEGSLPKGASIVPSSPPMRSAT